MDTLVDIASFYNFLPTASLILRPDEPRFTIEAVNDAFLAGTGTTRSYLIGQGFFEAFPPNNEDDGSRTMNIRNAFTYVLQHKKPHRIEKHRYDLSLCEDNPIAARYWSVDTYPLLNDDETVQYIVQGSVDITALHIAEIELRQKHQQLKLSNELYAYVNKATNDVIYDWDIENDHIGWGDAFFRLFGYEEVANFPLSKWSSLVHPADVTLLEKDLHEALLASSQNNWKAAYRLKRLNGDYAYVEENGYIIRNEVNQAVRMIGVLRDVTESTQYVRQIEAQNVQLKEIAWTQAHLVRAPVARIMGLINLFNEPETEECTRSRLLSCLNKSAADLDCIIREIVAKSEADNFDGKSSN
ncbi:PAS domain-containing protein [Mucilaginibacter sp. PAMB04168]|uniref:PAS domain-containing protein n=1 Tax=Mucilaginibacter sp. PAMB04168 TaxID=3138567 RepID=UPI0031F678CD